MYVIGKSGKIQESEQSHESHVPGIRSYLKDPERAEDSLFVHSRRPNWGAAIFTRKRRDRCDFQFQDGKLRSFRADFLHLFEPVKAAESIQSMIAESLKEKHGDALAEKQELRRAPKAPVMSFDEQVKVFLSLYPEGFQDRKYREAVRSRKDGRRLKRLLDPAIDDAAQMLSEDVLQALIDREDYAGVLQACVDVLKKTSLASPSKLVKPLAEMHERFQEHHAKALVRMLYGEGPQNDRFREWLIALDGGGAVTVTWSAATLLPSLVQPNKHVCVRRKTFALQTRLISPRQRIRKHPSPKGYRRILKTIGKVREMLTERGLEPEDLLDVRQFIWETLRPKGQTILKELPAQQL